MAVTRSAKKAATKKGATKKPATKKASTKKASSKDDSASKTKTTTKTVTKPKPAKAVAKKKTPARPAAERTTEDQETPELIADIKSCVDSILEVYPERSHVEIYDGLETALDAFEALRAVLLHVLPAAAAVELDPLGNMLRGSMNYIIGLQC